MFLIGSKPDGLEKKPEDFLADTCPDTNGPDSPGVGTVAADERAVHKDFSATPTPRTLECARGVEDREG
jgi:hypothetical protein